MPKFKLKYDDLENTKTDRANTVVFNLRHIKQSKFVCFFVFCFFLGGGGGGRHRVDHTPKDEDDQNVNAAMIDLLDNDDDQDKDCIIGLINRKTEYEKCVKCSKKVLNGIRCSSWKKAWHCKCGELSKKDMKTTPVKKP